MKPINLTNQFLIAMPGLADPSFFQTVTYVFSHTDEGTMGIVINRPLNLNLGEIFTQMNLTKKDNVISNITVHDGGPANTDRGFIIHKPETKWQSSIRASDDIAVTTSRDILVAFSEGNGPEKSFIALGYAGWGAGQLEQELMENYWLNSPSDTDIIFETPIELRWEVAASLIGVNMQNLSSDIGHA